MADVVASIVGRCCGGGVGIREIHSIAHGPVLEWRFKLNKQEDRHVDGSKRKIRKKETEGGQEPALDPGVGLQGGTRRGQPSFNLFARKDLRARFGCKVEGGRFESLFSCHAIILPAAAAPVALRSTV
jgi:hypothetical protein